MQPDPSFLLAAIRREILAPDFFGAGLEVGLSPIHAQRAGVALAQLEMRHAALPGIAAGLRPRQLALLAKLTAGLREIGATPPDVPPETLPDEAGEVAIARYERLASEISAGISLWSREYAGRSRENFDMFCREAAGIEQDLRAACNQAMDALREAHKARDLLVPAPLAAPRPEDLAAYIRAHVPGGAQAEVTDFRRLPGANSKDIYLFTLAGLPGWPEESVLRRQPSFNVTETSVADEFELLRLLHDSGVPVPRVLLTEREASHLGGAFLVMERVPGAVRLPETLGVDGLKIVADIARHMAGFHNIDVATLPASHRPAGGLREQMLDVLEHYYQRWCKDRRDSSMALEAGFAWMRANVDCLGEDISLVHGDCNHRNILIDGDHVSVFLDWELAHAGHAAEDLGYIRPDIEKIVPWPEFMAMYRQAGGRHVTDEALRYFQVWSNVWRTAMAVSCYAGYPNGGHRNFILATVGCNEYYPTLDDLCSLLIAGA